MDSLAERAKALLRPISPVRPYVDDLIKPVQPKSNKALKSSSPVAPYVKDIALLNGRR
jgi:hypothetical protein